MFKKKEKIFIGILLLAGFLCYINALPNKFLWDDEEQIVNNAFIKKGSNFPLAFSSSTFYSGQEKPIGGFYRPWVTLSYMFLYRLFGLRPSFFHLFQIFFHLLNIVLVFFVLRKILSVQLVKNPDKISFFAALLFAVHPANVESAGYIASVGEVIYVFLGLMAVLFFLRGINYQTKNVKNSALFLFFIFVFLGLLAKESGLVIIPLLFLYLLFFVRPNLKLYLKYIFGSFFISLIYFLLKHGAAKIGTNLFFLSPISKASLFQRFLTLPYEIFSYILIIFFPKNLYIYRNFVVNSISDIRFWGSLIFLLVIAAIFVWLAKRKKSLLLLFFLLWFLVSIFPTLNIIMPLEMTIAERWLYFPIIGALALVSYAAFQLLNILKKKWQKSLILGFLILALFSLSLRTLVRLNNWKDGLTLYERDIKFSKNSYNLENNYGVELFRAGRFEEAKSHFLRSIEIENQYYISHNNLGACYEKDKNFEEALKEYQKSMELNDYYLAYENTAGLLLQLNKDKEAKEFLEKAIQKFPYHSKLKLLLAFFYYKNKEIPKAIGIVEEVLKEEPDNNLAKQFLLDIMAGGKIQ